MLFTFLLRIIRGSLRIEVRGPFLERFINLVNMQGLKLWNIRRMGENLFRLSISVPEFRKLRPILKKTSARVHILRRQGLPFLLHRYRKRWGLFLGMVCFTAIVFLMSAYVWSVDISGNKNITDEQVLSALRECGFYEGSLKSGLNLRSIRQKMRTLIPEISFIELNVKGSKAYVVITERESAPKVLAEGSPSNIIASRAAKIERTEITAGQPLVEVGDTVQKGQILVSGIIDSNEVGYFLIHSTGRIYGSSEYTLRASYPYSNEVFEKTGNFTQKKRLKLFNFYINLYLGGGIEYPFYDKIIRIEEAKIGEYVLPVELETVTYYEKVKKCVTSSKEEAENRARMMLEESSVYEFSGKEIVSCEISLEHTENECVATGKYIIIEDIAQQLLIETERNLEFGTDS